MQRILVPTDFSDNAFKALAYAAEIAKAARATVHLLHVIEPSLNMVTMQTDSLNQKVIQRSTFTLQKIFKSASAVYPDVKIIPFLAGGKVVESILKYADEKNIDLIVMGTKGAGGIKKYFVGTVAANTVSRATQPVLTIPVSYEIEPPTHILYATNRFERDHVILSRITGLAALFSAVVHVIIFSEGEEEPENSILTTEELAGYVEFLKNEFPGVKIESALLRGDDFEEAVDQYRSENGGDILAMITYPKSAFERIFQQSETRKMVFQSTNPILAVPAVTLTEIKI